MAGNQKTLFSFFKKGVKPMNSVRIGSTLIQESESPLTTNEGLGPDEVVLRLDQTRSHNEQHTTPRPRPIATGLSMSSDSRPKKDGKRLFQEKWCSEFTWLLFKDGVAQCKLCAKYPEISDKNSRVVQGFNGPFKLETFRLHDRSNMHRSCVEVNLAKETPECTPLAACKKKMDSKMFQHLEKLFNTAYYIAKHNKPFTDFRNLIVLLNKFDVDVKFEEYQNDMQCREFISHIASITRLELLVDIKQCNHVSILVDASTDNATIDELVLYVRYIKDRKVKEDFLSIVSLQSSTAKGYYNCINEEMESLGINWQEGTWMVGLGTDGAANMIGKDNGLVAQVKCKNNELVSQHCVAHKLNLSVLNSVNEVKYLNELDTVLKKLYKFYRNSPKRLNQLKTVAQALQTKLIKFQYLHKIRWVASKVGALNALLRNLPTVVVHLEDVSNEKGEDAAVAKGLLKKMKVYRFVATLHFLLDFLSVFKDVSLTFQKENLLLSQVEHHINGAINQIRNLGLSPGIYESSFVNATTVNGKFKDIQLANIDHESFEADKKKMISGGMKYLEKRFLESDVEVIKATAVFDTFLWPKGNLESFGNDKIEFLANHFHRHLFPDGAISKETKQKSLMSEWYEFKIVSQDLPIQELVSKALAREDRFPILSHLLSIVAVLPTSTASCERGFSHMNMIKSDKWSCIESSTLNDLMMIHLNGPSVQDFQPQKAVDKWYFSAKKSRHIQGHGQKRQGEEGGFDVAGEQSFPKSSK